MTVAVYVDETDILMMTDWGKIMLKNIIYLNNIV